jgi:hypothetical protein
VRVGVVAAVVVRAEQVLYLPTTMALARVYVGGQVTEVRVSLPRSLEPPSRTVAVAVAALDPMVTPHRRRLVETTQPWPARVEPAEEEPVASVWMRLHPARPTPVVVVVVVDTPMQSVPRRATRTLVVDRVDRA